MTDQPASGTSVDPGHAMHALAAELFPLHRAATGEGLRATLRRLRVWAPIELHEVRSGMRVFGWEIPHEWQLRDAYVADTAGRRLIDYRASNLHVMGYSQPVQTRMRWHELRPHLHSLPDRPHWIPYRTAWGHEEWGFCLSHRQFEQLERRGDAQEYDVCIDADFHAGSLTYGELLVRGTSRDEVLLSAHACHPSLANDNLSGIVVAAWLARELAQKPRRYSYRFLFAPATIGAVAWLALNQNAAERIQHGLVLSVLGDAGPITYKQSRRGTAEIDRAVEHVLAHRGSNGSVRPFEPSGYDERQYCSPGFNLPVGCLMRTPPGEYPQYHTSADDLSFLRPEALADSLDCCRQIIEVLEHNHVYHGTHPYCEPPLGRYGLYQPYGRGTDSRQFQQAVLWTLNLADGDHSLLDVAIRSGLPFRLVRQAAERLLDCGLLQTGAADNIANPFGCAVPLPDSLSFQPVASPM